MITEWLRVAGGRQMVWLRDKESGSKLMALGASRQLTQIESGLSGEETLNLEP
jgi:hypothetical protein